MKPSLRQKRDASCSGWSSITRGIHGSWLNMAEIEISIFARGCLSRRVASMPDLRQRIATLEAERNAKPCTITWRFTSHDARDKLHDLYPVIKNKLD
jgi:hypothetical protein